MTYYGLKDQVIYTLNFMEGALYSGTPDVGIFKGTIHTKANWWDWLVDNWKVILGVIVSAIIFAGGAWIVYSFSRGFLRDNGQNMGVHSLLINDQDPNVQVPMVVDQVDGKIDEQLSISRCSDTLVGG